MEQAPTVKEFLPKYAKITWVCQTLDNLTNLVTDTLDGWSLDGKS